MQAKYYLQNLIMNSVLADIQYLGIDSAVSPEVIDFIAYKQEAESSRKIKDMLGNVVKLDEHELAMAS
ncbi:hypothetical protein BPLS_P0880 [Bathymodiolus platifrons methanotrophic gill symbiont]|uniref:hypothetical protein n=2 Tax=Bathymodiolus platifrons methanotrophic gill symbiont TaxID=113268 RepID=UPI0011251357|nr:hypothetical protein [Bathymodiolus platifrons methanotrophic gill symbiont]GFO74286.1 hypothetical protein BPLS_P0880 [Bathymodiolus platifrons methanotrophic gill symbiont]